MVRLPVAEEKSDAILLPVLTEGLAEETDCSISKKFYSVCQEEAAIIYQRQ